MKQFYVGILFLAISSCTLYKELPIEIYEPSESTLPAHANKALFVYRNFKYNNDTLIHYYTKDKRLHRINNDPPYLDSMLAWTALSKTAQNLKTQNVCTEIQTAPGLFKSHRGKKMQALSPDFIQHTGNLYNCDLIISLEMLSCFYNEYSWETMDDGPACEVITATIWAIYDVQHLKLLERKTLIDTIFWNQYDEQGNYQAGLLLPPRLEALKIAAELVGENYAQHFYGHWQKVKRQYSVPPLPDFAEAEKYALENEWDKAIGLWQRYAGDEQGRMAINARYNLALAYEMKDDLETANRWIDAALQLATEYRSKEDIRLILTYKKVLHKRLQDLQKLENVRQK